MHSAVTSLVHSLARRDEIGGISGTCLNDPSSSPSVSLPPTLPQRCVQLPPTQRASPTAGAHGSGDTRHDTLTQYPTTTANPRPESMSSAGDSAVITPGSLIELEKSNLTEIITQKRSAEDSRQSKHSRGRIDPEKATYSSPSGLHSSSNASMSSDMVYEDTEGRMIQADKAVKILLFFSGPCVLLSAVNAVWTCVAIVITLLSQPIRLCARQPTIGQQLAGLLGPSLGIQLRCIYSSLPRHASENGSYHTAVLVAEHVTSPVVSFVMMFAAWTLVVYWVSSAIVGDPAGQDKRDDGKEAVLGLRNWWEMWLTRSMRYGQ